MEYAWLWWLGFALVLITLEVMGSDFIFLMLGLACLLGTAAALMGAGLVVQVVAVAVAAVVLLLLLRPWLRHRVMRNVKDTPMGADRYLGKEATVLEPVNAEAGLVRLEGGTWTARPAVEEQTFDVGQRVRVVRIEGATALVAATAAERMA